jgi:hypothetical protein
MKDMRQTMDMHELAQGERHVTRARRHVEDEDI